MYKSQGEGYSNGFSAHMQEMLDIFQKGAKIQLHADTDEIELFFMNIRDTRRVQDGFNQRGRYKARVVPFAVIANAEIQHVDIFIACLLYTSGRRAGSQRA